MAIGIRTRSVQEIVWEKEDECRRNRRRRHLAALDNLLTQLEECNLRFGGGVPETLRTAIMQAGVAVAPQFSAGELIEAIFEVQERSMLQQLSPPSPAVDDLRRRIAV